MSFKGRVWKSNGVWLIEVPLLNVLTQGNSKENAYDMLCDAIQSLVNKRNFSVKIINKDGEDFELYSDDVDALDKLLCDFENEHNQ